MQVVRGFDGEPFTNAAGVFCPGTGRWSRISCSPMRVARVKVVVAMSSMLYLVPSRGLDWRNVQHLH